MDMPPGKSRIKIEVVEAGTRKITLPPSNYIRLFVSLGLTFAALFFVIYRKKMWHPSIPGVYETFELGSGYGLVLLIVFLFVLFFLFYLYTQQKFAETILLGPQEMVYKTQKEEIVFTLDHLKTVRLREWNDLKRLTINLENELIELGQEITEPEREWLYRQIKRRYSL